MADIATLQARLAEAEDALHRLMTGAHEVQVAYGDKSVRFTEAKSGDLRAYIADLKRQLGTGKRARARRVMF